MRARSRWLTRLGFAFFAVVLTTSVACHAAELSTASKAEINALLDRLGQSGCEFNRNGTWYSSDKAKAHLTRKLGYLLDKKLIENTEQFIALGGTKSSMSGKEYSVRCPNQPSVPSAVWLTRELQAVRAKTAPASR